MNMSIYSYSTCTLNLILYILIFVQPHLDRSFALTCLYSMIHTVYLILSLYILWVYFLFAPHCLLLDLYVFILYISLPTLLMNCCAAIFLGRNKIVTYLNLYQKYNTVQITQMKHIQAIQQMQHLQQVQHDDLSLSFQCTEVL